LLPNQFIWSSLGPEPQPKRVRLTNSWAGLLELLAHPVVALVVQVTTPQTLPGSSKRIRVLLCFIIGAQYRGHCVVPSAKGTQDKGFGF